MVIVRCCSEGASKWRRRNGEDARGRSIPDVPVRPSRSVNLVVKSANAIERLDQPILASKNGGQIEIRCSSAGGQGVLHDIWLNYCYIMIILNYHSVALTYALIL